MTKTAQCNKCRIGKGVVFWLKKIFKRYPYMEMRKLLIDILKNIGCQPEVNKEFEKIDFKYQGKGFFIDIESESFFTIYDTWWGTVDLDDPNIENLKEAINTTNVNATPVTLYSIEKDENLLVVHSRYRMSLAKETPNKETLFMTVLDSFFSTHKEVYKRFTVLNDAQSENKKENGRVRIRGFAASGDVTNQKKENNG